MIEQGGREYAEDDGDRFAEPGGKDDGEELRLVANLRDGDDGDRRQKGFHSALSGGRHRTTTQDPADPCRASVSSVWPVQAPWPAARTMAEAKFVDASSADVRTVTPRIRRL